MPLATVVDCHRHEYGYVESDETTTPSTARPIRARRAFGEAFAATVTAPESVAPAIGLLIHTVALCLTPVAAFPRSGSATTNMHSDSASAVRSERRSRRSLLLVPITRQPVGAVKLV